MKADYIEIGCTPSEEDCEQVGMEGYSPIRAKIECRAFLNQIVRVLGKPPEGARLIIKSNPHDFGSYHEVVCCYESERNEEGDWDKTPSFEYALRCESECPEYWDRVAKEEMNESLIVHCLEPKFVLSELTSPKYQHRRGSISHGTMRQQDLMPTFLEALEEVIEEEGDGVGLDRMKFDLSSIKTRVEKAEGDDDSYWESAEAGYDLQFLFDKLDEYAPPYHYFGANEGDGSDYGWWIIGDSIQDAVKEGNMVVISSIELWKDIPREFVGDVLVGSVEEGGDLYRIECLWRN